LDWGKGETTKAPLPFSFEKNATKDYAEVFSFNVRRKNEKPLTANPRQCEMYPVDAGSVQVLTINSTGWSLGPYKDVRCTRKWDVQKSGTDDDIHDEW
jgi:hypothetical protein